MGCKTSLVSQSGFKGATVLDCGVSDQTVVRMVRKDKRAVCSPDGEGEPA